MKKCLAVKKIDLDRFKGVRRLIISLVSAVAFLNLTTCITPLDVEPSDFEDFLVVEGFITDDFGPHRIRISRVTEFSGVLQGGVFFIEEADVKIIDQEGQSTVLKRISVTEKRQGSCGFFLATVLTDYQTPETFKGEIGSTYTLEFSTKDGEIYRSAPQTMMPTPPIDSLNIAFKELPSLNLDEPESGVEVLATWQDPVEQENYYFWRINGIYRIYTPPFPGRICCIYDTDGLAEHCWIHEKNIKGNELTFSDERTNGQEITLPVGLIMDDGLRFGNQIVSAQRQYYIEVEQYMISEDAYEFNKRVKTLNEINGEIFDPPPLGVSGNIHNTNDSEEIVIGYFGAYSKQTKDVFVPRSLLKFIKRFPSPCGDCRVGGGKIERPEPYKN